MKNELRENDKNIGEGRLVSVDTCTLLLSVSLTQLSVWFEKSMWARNVVKNLILNYLAVMILGCMIVGTRENSSQSAKKHAPASKLCMCFFLK